MASLRRTLSLFLVSVSLPLLGIPGCLGRSDLEEEAVDFPDGAAASGGASGFGGSVAGTGGSVVGGTGGGVGGSGGSVGGVGGGGASGGVGGAPGCGPQNCPGCCDAAGVCRGGVDTNACGQSGTTCTDCGALGFGCVNGGCEGPPPACGPMTCPGCCDAMGMCRFGSESDACGANGSACKNCAAQMQGCVNGACQGTPPVCGPANCGGCCDAQGTCRAGTANGACGDNGAACQNCNAQGRKCTQPGNYCAFIPSCGPATCPNGCCDSSGVCRNGRTDAACGSQGQACVNCSNSMQACAAQGFCYNGPHCGPDNCAGCCTSTGQCRGGTQSTSCGQYGVLCDNCLSKLSLCQNRVCSNGSTCPAAYPGCSPSSLTPPPVKSTSCKAADLSGLAMACAGPSPGMGCGQYFQQLLSQNPGCYDCMLQFAADQGALTRCMVPYLTQSCNHALTCAVDCSSTSCEQCSDAQQQQCQDDAFSSGGACQSWINGYYCANAALEGPAAFCDFSQFDDVGKWLESVGTHYCAP